jgi:hypothetical protein
MHTVNGASAFGSFPDHGRFAETLSVPRCLGVPRGAMSLRQLSVGAGAEDSSLAILLILCAIGFITHRGPSAEVSGEMVAEDVRERSPRA